MREDIARSAEIVEGTLLVTSGEPGFHMRPIVALATLLKDFEREHGVGLALHIGDKAHTVEKLSLVKLTLSGLVKWKQFTVRAHTGHLSEDKLEMLRVRILGIEAVGRRVPGAVNRTLDDR